MKIAIPVWEGKVSPVCDTASRLLVIEVDRARDTSRFEVALGDHGLVHRCHHIKGLGIDTLLCGAISRQFLVMLTDDVEIQVIPWVSGRWEDVLRAFLEGNLFESKFLMPGCRWQRCRPGSGRARHRSGHKGTTKKEGFIGWE